MKKCFVSLLAVLMILLSGCAQSPAEYDITATTLPVFDFTAAICQDTDLTVGRLITENVSCLHDYSLQVSQMRMIEASEVVVISGAGLEDFMEDALYGAAVVIDASENTHIHTAEDVQNTHDHHDGHHHESDPHIWLSPENAKQMAANICAGLCKEYPEYDGLFRRNLDALLSELDDLQTYGNSVVNNLNTSALVTFHDGFAYFAESFDLTILEAVEEESGSEASAAEIIHLVDLVQSYHLPAIFTEISGSDACAGIISAETGVNIYTLDMAMSENHYFDAMYHNINTIKEALS